MKKEKIRFWCNEIWHLQFFAKVSGALSHKNGSSFNKPSSALFPNNVQFDHKLLNLCHDAVELLLNNGKLTSDPFLPPKASSKEDLNCCSCSSESSLVPLNRRVTKLAAVETSVFIVKFSHELKGETHGNREIQPKVRTNEFLQIN